MLLFILLKVHHTPTLQILFAPKLIQLILYHSIFNLGPISSNSLRVHSKNQRESLMTGGIWWKEGTKGLL